MRRVFGLALAITLFTAEALAQNDAKTARPAPLVLTGAIPLEHVRGRMDHFGSTRTTGSSSRLWACANHFSLPICCDR
jgi:hypothetical protein